MTLKVRIAGTGRALPERCVTTRQIEADLGLAPDSLFRATGVRQRYVCTTETQVSLAVTAARAALDDAGLAADQIGLVLCGAAVPYQPIPATAPLVMRGLGMADGIAGAFDVNSTCLSFVTALDLAARHVEMGQIDHALVVSSELASRALPWQDDPETAAIFGDGAGAAVVSRAGPTDSRIVASRLKTFPSAYESCGIGAGGTRFDFVNDAAGFAANSRFSMDGKSLFRVTALNFRSFVDALLAEAGWTQSDVDLVVPHQASPAALEHMIRHCGFRHDQALQIASDHGNQIAASIPFALDMARTSGCLGHGSKALFLGTSAGVSFGGMALVL